MKVTFLIPEASLSGGIRVIAEHAHRLRQRGHEVLVVSQPGTRPTIKDRLRSLAQGDGFLPTAHRPSPTHLDALGVPHRSLPRRGPVRERDLPDADVLVATWWENAAWAAALPPRKGAPVYFVQGDDSLFYPDNDEFHRRAVRDTFALPMHQIAVSAWVAGRLHAGGGTGRVAIVHNAVDLDRFRFVERERNDPLTVGFVYATSPLKGADLALAAVEEARRSLPSLRVIVFGSEHPLEPLPDWVEFHSRPDQSAIPALYAACDAWLFPSRMEGFGLPILEAMASGTPVIAMPAGAAPELLADGGGWLVAPEDSSAMARDILALRSMPPRQWRSHSARAREVAQRHGWEAASLEFERELAAAAQQRLSGAR
ncbi:MAG: glycosyltransferase family 4 protein [Phycisphaerales bacterium]